MREFFIPYGKYKEHEVNLHKISKNGKLKSISYNTDVAGHQPLVSISREEAGLRVEITENAVEKPEKAGDGE